MHLSISRDVWSDRKTSGHFVPLTSGSVLQVASAKLDFELVSKDTDISVQPAVRYSGDGGATWSAVTKFGNIVTAEQWNYNRYYDLDATEGPLFELGLHTANVSGTLLHLARIRAEITLSGEKLASDGGFAYVNALRNSNSLAAAFQPFDADNYPTPATAMEVAVNAFEADTGAGKINPHLNGVIETRADLYVLVDTNSTSQAVGLELSLDRWSGSAWVSLKIAQVVLYGNGAADGDPIYHVGFTHLHVETDCEGTAWGRGDLMFTATPSGGTIKMVKGSSWLTKRIGGTN